MKIKRNVQARVGDKRKNCVSVRLSDAELEELNQKRTNYGKRVFRKGEFLRMMAFNSIPPVVPKINIDAWQELGRIGGNLNQIARKLNQEEHVSIDLIRAKLTELRIFIMGGA